MYVCMYVCVCQDGRTALMRASYNNHIEMVQLLLNRGADAKAVDKVTPALPYYRT